MPKYRTEIIVPAAAAQEIIRTIRPFATPLNENVGKTVVLRVEFDASDEYELAMKVQHLQDRVENEHLANLSSLSDPFEIPRPVLHDPFPPLPSLADRGIE